MQPPSSQLPASPTAERRESFALSSVPVRRRTGDTGIVYRITGPGKGEPYYATGQGNVTGLMLDSQGRSVDSLGRSDSDRSHSGELLLVARDGCLCRLPRKDGEFQQSEELVDLRQFRFQPRSTPPEATV